MCNTSIPVRGRIFPGDPSYVVRKATPKVHMNRNINIVKCVPSESATNKLKKEKDARDAPLVHHITAISTFFTKKQVDGHGSVNVNSSATVLPPVDDLVEANACTTSPNSQGDNKLVKPFPITCVRKRFNSTSRKWTSSVYTAAEGRRRLLLVWDYCWVIITWSLHHKLSHKFLLLCPL